MTQMRHDTSWDVGNYWNFINQRQEFIHYANFDSSLNYAISPEPRLSEVENAFRDAGDA